MKSLDFIKEKIKQTALADRDMTEALELNTKDYLLNYGDSLRYTFNYEGISHIVDICFSDDCDFDYFTYESSLNDGTLLFCLESISNNLNKILRASTYKNGCKSPIESKHIKYTIGNTIVVNECGDFGTEEKPWLHQRTTVITPIKYDVIE